MADLVQLDETDKLVGEDASSDDVLKMIQERQPQEEEEQTEPEQEAASSEPESTEEESSTEEKEEESKEEPEETKEEPKKESAPPVDQTAIYRQGLQDALTLLREKQAKAKEAEKALTPDQALDQFAADPLRFIDQAVAPYKQELERVKNLRALDVARQNEDYYKFEPIINRIREKHPNLIQTSDPLEREEAFLYLAKGMYQAEQERKNKRQEKQEKEKRIEQKKSASSLPASTKKVAQTKAKKDIKDMTSEEMLKAFPELRSHV